MESPIGRLWLAVSARGLLSISRGELPPVDHGPRTAREPDAAAMIAVQLEEYFRGHRRTFSFGLDLRAARRFDAAVWSAAREIPYGETASYGELAAMAGHPGAARAVGGSMARCPLSPVVPCHRVIHADGSMRGWGHDLWVKRWLLDLERRASTG